MTKLVFLLTSLVLVVAVSGCRHEATTPQLPANPNDTTDPVTPPDTLAGAGYVAGSFRGMVVYYLNSPIGPTPNDTTYSADLFLTRKTNGTAILRCPAWPYDSVVAYCAPPVDSVPFFGADSLLYGNVLPDSYKGLFIQLYYYGSTDSLYCYYLLRSSGGVGQSYRFFGRRS